MNGIIYAKDGNVYNNVSRLQIVVTPKSQIQKDEVITIKIKASTQEPYKKEISCEISLRVKQVTVNSYTIEDVPNRNYMILKLNNSKDSAASVTLEFNPNNVRIDTNDESYVNRTQGSESVNSKGYVQKFTFNINKESTRVIKFYKVDMTKDYTYPSGDKASIITIKTN